MPVPRLTVSTLFLGLPLPKECCRRRVEILYIRVGRRLKKMAYSLFSNVDVIAKELAKRRCSPNPGVRDADHARVPRKGCPDSVVRTACLPLTAGAHLSQLPSVWLL
jgi:hypothetical protein